MPCAPGLWRGGKGEDGANPPRCGRCNRMWGISSGSQTAPLGVFPGRRDALDSPTGPSTIPEARRPARPIFSRVAPAPGGMGQMAIVAVIPCPCLLELPTSRPEPANRSVDVFSLANSHAKNSRSPPHPVACGHLTPPGSGRFSPSGRFRHSVSRPRGPRWANK